MTLSDDPALAEKDYWEGIHRDSRARGSSAHTPALPQSPLTRATEFLRRKLFRSYADYRLWESCLKTHLPRGPEMTVLEIGSAPGHFLVRLHRELGYRPFGVEYTASGAETNRLVFKSNGIPPGRIFHVDFFDEQFRNNHANQFDVVLSRGFIEHHADPGRVIRLHCELLKPGGFVVVSIPNLTGVNYFLSWFFNKETLSKHNLRIMRKDAFRRLFPENLLEERMCDYYGTVDFNLFNTDPRDFLRRPLHLLCRLLQLPANLLLRLLLRDRGCETPWLSPYILYIGRKKI